MIISNRILSFSRSAAIGTNPSSGPSIQDRPSINPSINNINSFHQLDVYRSYCSYKDDKKNIILNEFWNNFYSLLPDICTTPDTTKSNAGKYHDEVIKLLHESKSTCKSSDDLILLQVRIEEMTMIFDEKSIYKTSPNLLHQLIRNDMPTAREYLKGYLSTEDLHLISNFGSYTLEAIVVYVLGLVFSSVNEFSVVRLSTLVDQLDTVVRVQAYITATAGLKYYSVKDALISDPKDDSVNEVDERDDSVNEVDDKDDSVKEAVKLDSKDDIKQGKRKGKDNRKLCAIGVHLVSFLVERELIVLSTDVNFTERVFHQNKGYYPLNCYAMCNFDFSLLPIKLNLPMVCKPAHWHINEAAVGGLLTLSDITIHRDGTHPN